MRPYFLSASWLLLRYWFCANVGRQNSPQQKWRKWYYKIQFSARVTHAVFRLWQRFHSSCSGKVIRIIIIIKMAPWGHIQHLRKNKNIYFWYIFYLWERSLDVLISIHISEHYEESDSQNYSPVFWFLVPIRFFRPWKDKDKWCVAMYFLCPSSQLSFGIFNQQLTFVMVWMLYTTSLFWTKKVEHLSQIAPFHSFEEVPRKG